MDCCSSSLAARKLTARPTPTSPTVTTKDDSTSTPEPTPTNVPDPTAVPTDVPQPEDTGGIDWEPQIIYSSPQPGEQVALNGAITVRFDQPMDQASVEDAFEISDGEAAPDGNFVWTRPDTMVFTPNGTFGRNTTYNVNIKPSAKSVNGKQLNQNIALQFETVGFFAS